MVISLIVLIMIIACGGYFSYNIVRKQKLEIELLKEIIKKG